MTIGACQNGLSQNGLRPAADSVEAELGYTPPGLGKIYAFPSAVGGLVPEVQQLVYFAPNTDQGFVDAVSTAVHASPTPAALSISWGAAEDLRTEQTDGKQHVDFPASSPHVLSCGGTPLRADPVNGVISSETVWNNGVGDHATGGGVSVFFPRPDYQSACGVPESGRGVPDVAASPIPTRGIWCWCTGRAIPPVAPAPSPRSWRRLSHGSCNSWGGR